MKQPSVYILANKFHGSLYVGVTSDLIKRIYEHKNEVIKGHTSKYEIKNLVWFEMHETMESAIIREKLIKKWKREFKYNLVEKTNPSWKDLYDQILGIGCPVLVTGSIKPLSLEWAPSCDGVTEKLRV